MRVVIDTNVWISRLLLADSVAARAVDKALEVSFGLAVTALNPQGMVA